ncbi:TssN family type VI secretion system protein [Flavilitoribacter nigricans]|uniref:TssN family type VI secretion system protein n=1 Tax=Flavilitoribacter nigricans (strain ATCC 23147 / DSM 23189 / NBRC 102662 / NCIMB 1420 / SS-2) TaxID=1122177 RepID=A0A2D0NBF9_FLAN2|nr:TssN family type VI secretion system protein [Flavilitoribacter nigricans]PHN05103.1 hypothetical protein CRP01_18960 [Flavilitoribacter nigricans DSM 23189 = NBRC 102662]
MSAFYIELIVLICLSILFLLLFLWRKEGDLKKNTIWQIALSFLIIGAIGALGGWLIPGSGPNNHYFLWFQLMLFLLGIIHTWVIYKKLFWKRRDVFNKEEDSFFPEFFYTLFITSIAGLGFFLAFYLVSQEFELAQTFTSALIVFPLPFIILKSFDTAQQIEKNQFEYEWEYSPTPINHELIDWNPNARIHFAVMQNFSDQNKFFKKRDEKPWSNFPVDDTSLGTVFQVFVQLYSQNHPNLAIQDLMANEDGERVWWLFTRKFRLSDSRTWGGGKYLNPEITLPGNDLSPGDVVYATRMIKY